MIVKLLSQTQYAKIRKRLLKLYGTQADGLIERFFMMIGRYGVGLDVPVPKKSKWNESDVVLITYANTIRNDIKSETPLIALRRFCEANLKGATPIIHLLPFYPWSSDDGFSVIDYREVDSESGTWRDVEQLGQSFELMFDYVMNHCSAESAWFKDYVLGIQPARHYFLEMDPDTDLSQVVRPRTSPLLTPTATREGDSHIWTTFSADQVDMNWQNPDVLFEFLDILFLYISKGSRILRLDAVAFLWKELGTTCIHHENTHEIVRLFRDVVEAVAPDLLILTETNVPHDENISYFGRGNEAHMVYNFSLPPLLLHGLLRGDTTYLYAWAKDLSPPPKGCTYFNFTASHDGVGVRPLQGLVPDSELDFLVEQTQSKGGEVSFRSLDDGSQKPYELNITYVSALSEPGDDALTVERVLCSQALAFSFRGMPAVYIHTLLGTPNWQAGFEETGRNRTLNRRHYHESEINEILADPDSIQTKIMNRLVRLLRRRSTHSAFHPDGAMIVHDLGSELFGFTRISPDEQEVIICIFNFTAKKQSIKNPGNTPLLKSVKQFYDIVSGKTLGSGRSGLVLDPYQALWLVPRS
ncbi:MAG: sugar phosphorylase [Verrucomicrobiota bacterium]